MIAGLLRRGGSRISFFLWGEGGTHSQLLSVGDLRARSTRGSRALELEGQNLYGNPRQLWNTVYRFLHCTAESVLPSSPHFHPPVRSFNFSSFLPVTIEEVSELI